jgi:hypothetical protein
LAEPVTGRRIAGLALPALGVLAAEPLYLLFDLAVVGRLGAVALAGLAIGGLILALLSSQLTFLSYGTTARAARFFGAGDRASAVGEGVPATWLAVALGTERQHGPLLSLAAACGAANALHARAGNVSRRDVESLLGKVHPVDMFPVTGHIESVVRLERRLDNELRERMN